MISNLSRIQILRPRAKAFFIPRDTASRARGFAFVEMENENAAQEAIRELNGSKLGNRTLVVNKARPRAARADTGRDSGERRFSRG